MADSTRKVAHRPLLNSVLSMLKNCPENSECFIAVYSDGFAAGLDEPWDPSDKVVKFTMGRNRRKSVKKALDILCRQEKDSDDDDNL